jgi:hypothetical protein
MKKLSLVAAIVALAVAVPLGIGSSHREAPLTALDPTADDTDVYAFTAKDDPSTQRNEEKDLTVVANWIPFEDPAGGPNFYRFDDRADYYINVDNNGDGRYDVRYLFKFKTKVEDPETFLYAKPPVNSIDDPNLNVKQTYTVYRITYGDAWQSRRGGNRHHSSRQHGHGRHHRKHHKRGRASNVHVVTVARNVPVAPNNVGPKTIPHYDQVANEAITDLPGGGRVFAGQRDDPFFVDLGATFDALNIRVLTGDKGQGKDDLAGYAVHSIVLQVPERKVTNDGQDVDSPGADNAVVGVWSSTERPRLQVTDSGEDGKGGDVQVSRLGNPLVNEVVIPLGKKDYFNSQQPANDAQFAKYVLNPEVARLMNALFGLGVKETDRTDIVQALLQGLPGLNRQTGKPVDTLKVNLGIPPAATENRFGALAGDVAGFPDGRRLGDDVVDIELRVIAGALLPPPETKSIPLGDGVDQNDKPFLSTFPYVASPTSGFDSSLKRTEPAHPSE